jgi:hypothetical protein
MDSGVLRCTYQRLLLGGTPCENKLAMLIYRDTDCSVLPLASRSLLLLPDAALKSMLGNCY